MEMFDNVDPNFIIRQCCTLVGDPEFKTGLTKGWYMTQLRMGLDELSWEAPFKTLTTDFTIKTDGDIDPLKLHMEMPRGIYNVMQMYVWSGDCCEPSNSMPVYWKRQYNNAPGGTAYTSQRKDNNNGGALDPFIPNFGGTNVVVPYSLYYYNIQDGMLMVSASCAGFGNLRIVYSGTNGDIGDCVVIPRYFAKFLTDWLKWHYYQAMNARNPRVGFMSLVQEAYSHIYDARMGSWWLASNRASKMSPKERADVAMYNARGNW